jgi:glucose-6-phosphate 1-dehydrogenase
VAKRAPKAPPVTLVIFGAMGDLTRRLLIPALANLRREKLVGDGLKILGVSHHAASDDDLRKALDQFVDAGDEGWRKLRGHIAYLKGDFDDDATFAAIAARLGGKGNAAFYLATAPGFFGPIVEKLAQARLLDEINGFRRVLIEKPFGHDLASAKALNAKILSVATERQIYRMDHFLGKETVQNIMVTRFANPLFEAVWNNRYVDHIQITAAETVGIGSRGKFYDATGALRDMVPNHLFQLLAMIGMEPPNSFDADAIRTEKAKVAQAVRRLTSAEIKTDVVRGRYTASKIGDQKRPAYLAEADIAPDSSTETYVALKLFVDTWRWAGVPFYLRTGKAMSTRDTEIIIQFKPVPFALFRDVDSAKLPPNRFVIQIQPDEGIGLDFLAKLPGPTIETAPASMDFCYKNWFDLGKVTGYETLLYDMMVGEQMLFQRADAIEAGWAAVQPILDAWRRGGRPLSYKAGSDGPTAAAELPGRDGRNWNDLKR